MADANLIKSCQQGDLDSFNQLYRLYSKNALGVAYLISGKKGIAEDIVQEAFMQSFSEIKSLKDPETFDVWFYKILVRTGWRMERKHRYSIPMEDCDLEGFNTDRDLTPGLEDCETRITIGQALQELSLPLRTVIILHYWNDMTIKDMARILSCFPGTVKSRLHKARKQLSYELYGAFYEDPHNSLSVPLCIKKGVGLDGKHA